MASLLGLPREIWLQGILPHCMESPFVLVCREANTLATDSSLQKLKLQQQLQSLRRNEILPIYKDMHGYATVGRATHVYNRCIIGADAEVTGTVLPSGDVLVYGKLRQEEAARVQFLTRCQAAGIFPDDLSRDINPLTIDSTLLSSVEDEFATFKNAYIALQAVNDKLGELKQKEAVLVAKLAQLDKPSATS